MIPIDTLSFNKHGETFASTSYSCCKVCIKVCINVCIFTRSFHTGIKYILCF